MDRELFWFLILFFFLAKELRKTCFRRLSAKSVWVDLCIIYTNYYDKEQLTVPLFHSFIKYVATREGESVNEI